MWRGRGVLIREMPYNVIIIIIVIKNVYDDNNDDCYFFIEVNVDLLH